VYLNLRFKKSIAIMLFAAMFLALGTFIAASQAKENGEYIKWVEFTPTYAALEKALALDISSREQQYQIDWVELLAMLAVKYGGDFSRYKQSDMIYLANKLSEGDKAEAIMAGNKYYAYYYEAYEAVLGAFVGEYIKEFLDENGNKAVKMGYGLKAFSPIAMNWGYSHFDDFGQSRSYGFRRKHLGNDLTAPVGTPVVAVESGTVEAIGWNRYGGWRIGIRSLDGKRYYYYAHLRKGHPYAAEFKEGDKVLAGDVIGYVGMTGYSIKEDVNGMQVPHLHFGMQLIFDESQKESNNEIWIDVYNIVKLLYKNRSAVVKDAESGEYIRKYSFEAAD